MAKPKSRSHSRKALKRKRAKRAIHRRKTNAIQFALIFAALSSLAFITYNHFSQPPAELIDTDRLLDNPSKGSDSAIVTMIEYADFGCPSCRAWHEAGIFEELLAEFGDNLRIEWRDLPVITARSPQAAEAGQCAYDQGMFWEYHDIIFANAPEFSNAALISYAEQAGLQVDPFTKCLSSGKHRQTVQYDQSEAFKLGLRGTPSFIINGQPVIGPNPILIRSYIEAAIANTH